MENVNKIEFKPYSTQFSADPYPVYAALRESSPIFFDPDWGVTFITRHEDISRLLVHKSLGRTLEHVLNADEVRVRRAEQVWANLPNYGRFIANNLLETEGEDHLRLRRLLVKGFTTAQIELQRDGIQKLVDESLDRVRAVGSMDFLEDLVAPVTVSVIGRLLGLPDCDHHRLRPWSAAIVRLYEKDLRPEDAEAAELATTEFVDYLADLLEQRRSEPTDDLISVLAQVEDDGLMLKNDELISTCILLLNAGHESTVNAAGNGMLALLSHPEQYLRLAESPELIDSAIEEMLRYDPPLHYFHRYVLEDFAFKGFGFKKGETLGFLYGSANRDPEAFESPDQFDIVREPNKHLAFGKGRHFCLGAQLARLELEIVFTSVLRSFRNIQLAQSQPEHHPGLVFRGLKALQLKWDVVE
ncbi:MAG: cytochrome P450 [Halioglobus sp.]